MLFDSRFDCLFVCSFVRLLFVVFFAHCCANTAIKEAKVGAGVKKPRNVLDDSDDETTDKHAGDNDEDDDEDDDDDWD